MFIWKFPRFSGDDDVLGVALLQVVNCYHYRSIYVYGCMILININNDDEEAAAADDITVKTVNRPIFWPKNVSLFFKIWSRQLIACENFDIVYTYQSLVFSSNVRAERSFEKWKPVVCFFGRQGPRRTAGSRSSQPDHPPLLQSVWLVW